MVCIWRLKDGKAVTEKYSELITTLQWKPKQKDGTDIDTSFVNSVPLTFVINFR